MKLKGCTTLALFAMGFSLYAQETREMPVIQTISIQKGQEQVTHDKAFFEAKIQEVDAILAGIDEKVRYVKSDEAEHKLALENGWYQQMEESIVHARRVRQEYVIKLASFK